MLKLCSILILLSNNISIYFLVILFLILFVPFDLRERLLLLLLLLLLSFYEALYFVVRGFFLFTFIFVLAKVADILLPF
jgi:hypothetical protein